MSWTIDPDYWADIALSIEAAVSGVSARPDMFQIWGGFFRQRGGSVEIK